MANFNSLPTDYPGPNPDAIHAYIDPVRLGMMQANRQIRAVDNTPSPRASGGRYTYPLFDQFGNQVI